MERSLNKRSDKIKEEIGPWKSWKIAKKWKEKFEIKKSKGRFGNSKITILWY